MVALLSFSRNSEGSRGNEVKKNNKILNKGENCAEEDHKSLPDNPQVNFEENKLKKKDIKLGRIWWHFTERENSKGLQKKSTKLTTREK